MLLNYPELCASDCLSIFSLLLFLLQWICACLLMSAFVPTASGDQTAHIWRYMVQLPVPQPTPDVSVSTFVHPGMSCPFKRCIYHQKDELSHWILSTSANICITAGLCVLLLTILIKGSSIHFHSKEPRSIFKIRKMKLCTTNILKM